MTAAHRCQDCLSWVELFDDPDDTELLGECDCPFSDHYGAVLAGSHAACDAVLTEDDLHAAVDYSYRHLSPEPTDPD